MPSYGAWELKTGYQRNLSFSLVCSLLVSLSLFLVTYFFSWVQVLPTDLKKHTIRLKPFRPLLGSLNPSPLEPVRPPIVPLQPPRKGRLMIDSLMQALDLDWPESPLFPNDDLSETGLGGYWRKD